MIPIFENLLLNISMLVLIAFLLTRSRLISSLIFENKDRLLYKLTLMVIFGLIGIVSTYTGIKVNGAIANTRAIAAVAGGILGGPMVGLGAGLIAGLHRFLIDIGGFTAVACGLSTLAEGLLGGLYARYIKRSSYNWGSVFLLTVAAEVLQMLIILAIARPFAEAWQLVQVISVPMILFNSLGVVAFVSVFDTVFIAQDRESARRISLVLEIADRCLPFLRKGLYDKQNLDQAVKIIYELSSADGVAITDREQVLSCAMREEIGWPGDGDPLPDVALRAMETGRVQSTDILPHKTGKRKKTNRLTIIAAPLTQRGEPIGCLVLFMPQFLLTAQAKDRFADGLARLFSTQLELSQIEYQKKMLHKAEFQALQSQINPHFLFNALNTITAFCREDPERARELLITLATYFRNTLQSTPYMISLHTELEHVNAYLKLEKARFGSKLAVDIDIPPDLHCIVPSFILQPIVENAVKHGAMCGRSKGRVQITAQQRSQETVITVRDNGPGIEPEVVQNLYNDTISTQKVGLVNVHKRLKSIYGENNGLLIYTSPQKGTEVVIRIPIYYGGESA